jgi:hypothetical protein
MRYSGFLRILIGIAWLVGRALASTTVTSAQELRAAFQRGEQHIVIRRHLDLSGDASGFRFMYSQRFRGEGHALLVIKVCN